MVGIRSALIIGGTGSLGKELINQLLHKHVNINITVLSRCEHKQQALKKLYPKVRFVLGDIRDAQSLSPWFKYQDAVFHVAALKAVDHVEENPIESVKTNILGTINVAQCAIENSVRHCVFSSTDKAVDPLNVYGNCKAISEKILHEHNRNQKMTKFIIYRWGNICASNGSAIPYFIECLKNKKPVPITSLEMTRFWITLDLAVDYVLSSFFLPHKHGVVLIPPFMKSAKVIDVISCLAEMLHIKDYQTEVIGLRRGEKLHECLTSMHAPDSISSETCERLTDSELVSLLYKAINPMGRPKLERVK